MSEENRALSALPSEARKGLEDFSQSLQETLGDNLAAVILYGSAALGDYIPGHSDLNVLVVLDDASVGKLKQAAKVVQQARRKRAIEPRFMSAEEMRRATDVLPISFLDMQENYAMLHGRDALAHLVISHENLRLQCESQLRVILLRMRHRFLYAIRDRQRLRTILSESFTKFLHILKTLYRLEGETPPTGKADIVAGAAERYGLDRDALTGLLELKLETRRFSQKELEELFEGYLSIVKAVTTQVDRMAVG
ncbi:MAG: nucleotidyltransferase domain-containing protein [Anaerolineae bacterium]